MASSDPDDEFQLNQKHVIELTIRLGVLFALIFWCFTIIKPFVLVMIWGIIVAIALYPALIRLAGVLGGREKPASIVLVLLLITILVVPTILLTDSLVNGAQVLANAGDNGDFHIPPPPKSISTWPLIGASIYSSWQKATTNLPALLTDFMPQIKALGSWALGTVASMGLTILQFVASFFIAGVFWANANTGKQATVALATRLAGGRGTEFASLASGTIRNVAMGIVGISILQTAMLSAGYLAIGLPGAGLLALLTLILCIVQIGPTLIAVPAIIYVFSTADTTPATLFAIWTFGMMISDNFLKPIVFGRGAAVPTLVIFIGTLGGMLAYGIIGLFVGAVVLSVGYKLYEAWLMNTPQVDNGSEPARSTVQAD